jgi:iron complex transport system ATP-binding protein
LIARALTRYPLIILDEPTTHLDLLHKVALFKLLKLTQETGKCILFSTHDIDMAIQLSDEMIIMTPEIVLRRTCNFIAKAVSTRYLKTSILF